MTAKKTQQDLLIIIDGNAIIHRAYHALPPLTDKNGRMVNAVYGFTSMLLKVMHDLQPTHLAVSFDVAGKTFRDDLYEKYKATRVKADQELYDQIPLVHDVVRAFGFPILTKEGFEADDVIGTIIEKTKKQKIKTVIVTGDMDMLQLVGGSVRVYELRKGLSDIVIFDEKKVAERYGFGPEHIVDYKALRGDPSDNIPGIKGIGEKGASELIQTYGSIDALYKRIKKQESKIKNELKPALLKKLVEGEKDARMSLELGTIRRDVPGIDVKLDGCRIRELDREKIMALFQEFNFASLAKRLPGAAGTPKLLAKKPGEIVEANGKTIAAHRVFVSRSQDGAVLCLADDTVYRVREGLEHLFADADRTVVGHDVKPLVRALFQNGHKSLAKLFDIMIASYLLNSSTRAHDLASIALRELGKELPADAAQTSLFGRSAESQAAELFDIQAIYERFVAALKDGEELGLFEEMEMKLIPVLARMEMHGVAIDHEMLKELSAEVARDISRITKKIWKEAGMEFNVASSVQLREVLFQKMQLPLQGIKKGKTGFSTAASELEKLRGLHPVIEMIEEHRELAKLQNTYIDVLPTLVNEKTGRVHTTFNQAVAATGRLSSSDPNLQNIPIRTDLGRRIRDAFVAAPGSVLLAADYSQIELRIVASLAEDETMMRIFDENKDIHAATAAVVNRVPLEKVTKEMRSAAKEVNFGVLYGMGAYGLASRTGISQAEAEDFIQKYFEQFAGVKAYIDRTVKFARKEGYVETLFGRRRYIPELKASNFQVRAAGERMAVNMPIQGTAADLMKMAMIKIDESIKNTDVKMMLQVHDELVFEIKKGLEEEVAILVKREMETVAKLRVPIVAHVAIGERWGQLK